MMLDLGKDLLMASSCSGFSRSEFESNSPSRHRFADLAESHAVGQSLHLLEGLSENLRCG